VEVAPAGDEFVMHLRGGSGDLGDASRGWIRDFLFGCEAG
jgi:hypothetical protein